MLLVRIELTTTGLESATYPFSFRSWVDRCTNFFRYHIYHFYYKTLNQYCQAIVIFSAFYFHSYLPTYQSRLRVLNFSIIENLSQFLFKGGKMLSALPALNNCDCLPPSICELRFSSTVSKKSGTERTLRRKLLGVMSIPQTIS